MITEKQVLDSLERYIDAAQAYRQEIMGLAEKEGKHGNSDLLDHAICQSFNGVFLFVSDLVQGVKLDRAKFSSAVSLDMAMFAVDADMSKILDTNINALRSLMLEIEVDKVSAQ
jgi:hypothetical protein